MESAYPSIPDMCDLHSKGLTCAMCGRLRVGKDFPHVDVFGLLMRLA